MTAAEEHLIEWLRTAHAVEAKSEIMLKSQARRLAHYPQLRDRFEQHLQETRRQAELVRGCIERRGGSVSVIKDTGAKLLGMSQAAAILFTSDAVIKELLESTTFEAMEAASYRLLIAAADQVGDIETAQVCRPILREEEAMEQWLKDNLQSATRAFLTREGTPAMSAVR